MRVKLGLVLLLLSLTGCATFEGPRLTPGTTTQQEVLSYRGRAAACMGRAQRVSSACFGRSGPAGTSTIMARFDAKKRLISYEEVLNMPHFADIQSGMTMDEVTRLIGPPYARLDDLFQGA